MIDDTFNASVALSNAARRNVDSLGIKYNELPQLPFWAPLFGRTNDAWKTQIAAKIMADSAAAGRELSQAEKDALACHTSKILITAAYTGPVGLALTWTAFFRTKASYGFPFWTPNPNKFNPSRFPLLPEGRFSQGMWHTLRMTAWYTVCKMSTVVVLSSYASSVYLANYSADSRLAAHRQAIKERTQQLPSRGSGPQQRIQSQDFPNTQGLVAWAGSAPDDQGTPSPQAWSATSKPQTESAPDSDQDESYMFDDASPVAPSEQRSDASRQPTEQGSAWERIRSQGRNESTTSKQVSDGQTSAWKRMRENELTSRGAQQGTSFTFSSSDEERAYAKEQAQKEFDEMLERERRGPSDGSQRG